MQKRAVIYIRVEDFVASFEEARRPDLKGAPFVVLAPEAKGPRGIVAAVSRSARRQKILPNMTVRKAREIFPDIVFLPFDAPSYEKESQKFFDLISGYSPLVESFGLNSAFIEPANKSAERLDVAVEVATELRARVKALLKLPAKAGIGENKFLAKVAFDLARPGSLNVIRVEDEKPVLEGLPIKNLPGITAHMIPVFKSIGVSTVGQLRALPKRFLEAKFGKVDGAMLHEFSHGRDTSQVVPFALPGSIHKEAVFETGVLDRSVVKEALYQLTSEALGRARDDGRKCRAVAIKLSYANLNTIAPSIEVPEPSDSLNDVWGSVAGLIDKVAIDHPVVLVGVRIFSQL